jgi:hypothetical protein
LGSIADSVDEILAGLGAGLKPKSVLGQHIDNKRLASVVAIIACASPPLARIRFPAGPPTKKPLSGLEPPDKIIQSPLQLCLHSQSELRAHEA